MSFQDRVVRVDAWDKAMGKAQYVADLCRETMLVGRILGSRYACADIISIDTSKAEALPGVLRVLTWRDAPQKTYSPRGNSYSLEGNVVENMYILTRFPRYVGDPIAAVVAVDELSAARALECIEVEYEVHPPVLTIEEALTPGAYPVHAENPDNIMGDFGVYEVGEVDSILSQAPFRVEGVYTTSAVQHCHIEPCGSFASMDSRGRITIVSSTQIPFFARRRCAEALGIPEGRIRIIKPYVGGGFGNKQDVVQEPLNALMTMAVGGTPVRLILTREETMCMTRTRHAFQSTVRLGADSAGKLLGMDFKVIANGGAYAAHNHAIALTAVEFARFVYDYGALRNTPVTVYTNVTSGGAMRGYGAPQGMFAVESAMDDLALTLGMDPLDLRLNNLVEDGYVDPPSGASIQGTGLRQCLERGAERIRWREKRAQYDKTNTGNLRRGVGVGCVGFVCATYPFNTEVSGARLTLNEDGTFLLQVGATEIGQGSDTAFTQLAAETLGTPVEDVIIVTMQDTDVSPYDGGAYATRQTFTCGTAVVEAARALREKIFAFVSRTRGVPAPNQDIQARQVVDRQTGSPIISLRDLALQSYFHKEQGDILTSEKSIVFTNSVVTFGCTFADVEVDISACKVKLKEIYSVFDAGRIVNRQLAEGQVHGGMSMGIGAGLMERLIRDEKGELLNDNFLDYKLPTAMDLPDFGVEFVEIHDPRGPFGAKGIGEPPAVTPAPAIRNAILHATGVKFQHLPITPHSMFEAFQEAGFIGGGKGGKANV